MHRLWCKSCNDWTIFSKNIGEQLNCSACKTDHVDTLLSEIPEEKLIEQRLRYKTERGRQFREMINSAKSIPSINIETSVALSGLLEIDRILESDAGQIAIDKIRKEQLDAANKAKKADIDAHKHLGRNDKCRCDSGKKYKNCCLSRIKAY